MSETPLEQIALRLAEVNESLTSLASDWFALRQEVRREVRQRTFALWCALTVAVVVVLAIGSAGFAIGQDNRRAIETNNRRWCPMVSLLIPQPGDAPVTTQRGRIVVERATELYQEFRCGR